MEIIIVVLYDDHSVEHYVGALSTLPSIEEQKKLAKKYGAILDGEDGSHEEDSRTISFRIVTVDDTKLINIWNE